MIISCVKIIVAIRFTNVVYIIIIINNEQNILFIETTQHLQLNNWKGSFRSPVLAFNSNNQSCGKLNKY